MWFNLRRHLFSTYCIPGIVLGAGLEKVKPWPSPSWNSQWVTKDRDSGALRSKTGWDDKGPPWGLVASGREELRACQGWHFKAEG